MRGTTIGLLGQRPRSPWTRSHCLLRRPQILAQRNVSYQLNPRNFPIRRPSKRGIFLLTVGATIAGAGSYYCADDVKFGYDALVRTCRVAEALFICINDYRTTLKQHHDDPEEGNATLKSCHKRCAVRTLRVMEKNGSIFVKLGQHLSSMGYLLPNEWVETFIPLQDKCPISSYESIQEMFLKDTGHRIEDNFDEFSATPIGAASLAQVHTAKLKGSGQKVAVKVQHPALERYAPLDLALTRFTFRTLKRFFPEYDLEWLSREMEFSLPQELDFSLEGKNAMRMSKYFKENSSLPLVIPDVISARPRILVMQYITGRRPDDLPYLDSNHISRSEVSATLARIFNTMIFAHDCPLHCDPHGGNLAIRPNPTRRYPYNFDVILYDHGLYRDIPLSLRRSYAHLWLAVIDADIPKMREYAYKVAGITGDQFPLFASAITGRDYRVLTQQSSQSTFTSLLSPSGGVVSQRGSVEKDNVTDAFGDNLVQQLVQLLGQVPRIILLILKTNDLTRSLDEGLQTGEGPERTFLILAKYASRTVYEEAVDNIYGNDTDSSSEDESTAITDASAAKGIMESKRKRPSNSVRRIRSPLKRWSRFVNAWLSYKRVEWKLWIFERIISLQRHLSIG